MPTGYYQYRKKCKNSAQLKIKSESSTDLGQKISLIQSNFSLSEMKKVLVEQNKISTGRKIMNAWSKTAEHNENTKGDNPMNKERYSEWKMTESVGILKWSAWSDFVIQFSAKVENIIQFDVRKKWGAEPIPRNAKQYSIFSKFTP